jgi:single-strand DNA-binding protein
MTSGYGDKKQTHWVDCAYWGAGGKAVAQYLTKGQKVAVSGELSMKPASDKYPAGFALRVNSLTLCGGKDSGGGASAPVSQPEPASSGVVFDDDIPF